MLNYYIPGRSEPIEFHLLIIVSFTMSVLYKTNGNIAIKPSLLGSDTSSNVMKLFTILWMLLLCAHINFPDSLSWVVLCTYKLVLETAAHLPLSLGLHLSPYTVCWFLVWPLTPTPLVPDILWRGGTDTLRATPPPWYTCSSSLKMAFFNWTSRSICTSNDHFK